MIELQYSLVIEATEEPDYFGFYSPDLEGFTGIGHSIEDCLYKAKWGMIEHVKLGRRSSQIAADNYSINYLYLKNLASEFRMTEPGIRK